ncbi:hypothetical protein GIB67_021650 [Kingdonia uniflora]|uniref:S1 motif domain-containing protein n=1 Tax=Kingdonia uniflora TaxID=39325 RepID=A0A7J7KY80_9MAGN|nr:hypothetical protein GIB67_021650 [Kingdonia uniflora]
MEGLSLRTTSCCFDRFIIPKRRRRHSRCCFSEKKLSFMVFASKENQPQRPKLDQWDQMELKFGQMLGEDPKLTMAKIVGRKLNPDLTYLEVEKSFGTKKGELFDEMLEMEQVVQQQSSKPRLSLVRRPVSAKFKESVSVGNDSNVSKVKKKLSGVVKAPPPPSVPLRKPSSAYQEDMIKTTEEKSSRMRVQSNLVLKMGKEKVKVSVSDVTLLKKPEPVIADDSVESSSVLSVGLDASSDTKGSADSSNDLLSDVLKVGLQPFKQGEVKSGGKEASISRLSYTNSVESTSDQASQQGKPERYLELTNSPGGKEASISEPLDTGSIESTSDQTSLQEKPERFEEAMKEVSRPVMKETSHTSSSGICKVSEIENFIAAPVKEREAADWTRAEELIKTGVREEVELISCSTRGFVASFGSLIGFLPYRYLGAKWKFLAFESWLKKKGLDPSMYKQKLGIVGGNEVQKEIQSRNKNLDSTKDQQIEENLSPDMKLEELLKIYDDEKLKYLSSFIGWKIKVNLVHADRKSRRLMFSGRPKEKEELVEKKRSLIAKLSIGNVVKCCIKKITYFGIFVEVDGVPALIHQSEVSWDATLDPSAFYKIGQIVEAKVHQLDFALERITLSLKEISPDPLIDALESVVEIVEASQEDVEWADVESLIKELQQIQGVQSVSKGRFFLSPGLAPTFQVYMGSVFEKQYKLLARSGNKVQEVIVQASMDKEEMKAAILTCTNRVE